MFKGSKSDSLSILGGVVLNIVFWGGAIVWASGNTGSFVERMYDWCSTHYEHQAPMAHGTGTFTQFHEQASSADTNQTEEVTIKFSWFAFCDKDSKIHFVLSEPHKDPVIVDWLRRRVDTRSRRWEVTDWLAEFEERTVTHIATSNDWMWRSDRGEDLSTPEAIGEVITILKSTGIRLWVDKIYGW